MSEAAGDERNEREKCFQEPTRNLDLELAPRLPSPRWNPGERKPPPAPSPSSLIPLSLAPLRRLLPLLRASNDERRKETTTQMKAQRRTRRRIAVESLSGESNGRYRIQNADRYRPDWFGKLRFRSSDPCLTMLRLSSTDAWNNGIKDIFEEY
ncbi:hypothetical protein BHE74_00047442 [Ensete ventricosum]|nr:hypothetical protein BHE74_00047442 [Ensete ventricosum]RZS28585.1 hypothetical protein BHM03_00062222 [Ensete ventricosum]